ncbi:MAG: PPC domain-containing protein [Planctomycetia bacterium]|nr:PPC domain-containing protein [Planctomycetia bacterium]
MNTHAWLTSLAAVLACCSIVDAEEPVASYIFPAGGQRGTKCEVRVGGLFLHDACQFDLLGPGVRASRPLKRTETVWFEGPLIPLPDSQQAEDYPQDYATQIEIAADAPLGTSYWRLATSQGATAARRFVVGELPEVVEQEIDGEPIPKTVDLPVTINGRIFPREDVDVWSFHAQRGHNIRAEVCASRLGSPLDARLEIIDAEGRKLAEGLGTQLGEASISFTPPVDGVYQVRIHDINFGGLQNYVYRLTLGFGPHVSAIFPLGARRGEKTRFELLGHGLSTEPVEVALPAANVKSYTHRFEFGGRWTNGVPIELDDLPEQIEREDNNDLGHAEPIVVPSIVNGRIQSPGDVDCFALTATKGQTYEFDLRASRLGSPLDGVLVVFDSTGKEVLRSDDMAVGNTDSQCRYTAPADGVYTVAVEDRLSSRGGPAFAYRLRIDAARPDYRLLLASDAVNLVRGKEAKLRIDVDAIAPVEVPIDLHIEGLPASVKVEGTQIPAKARQVELKLTAAENTPIQTGRLVVRGTAKIGEQEIARTAELNVPRGDPPIDHVFWAVALPTPFKFVGTYKLSFEPRGGFVERHYRLLRNGYNGPLEVSLADRQMRHLQGITGPSINVPANADQFDYSVFLPPWMDLGRTSRTVLMAVGTLEDFDGSQHVVSYSTVEQNEQVVIRVSSGLLTLASDRESILAQPRASTPIKLSITRDPSHLSPVKLELIVPPHIRGVKAEPVILSAAQTTGQLTIEYAADCGPFNGPLTVRATSIGADRAATAETRLEIVAPR